MTGIEFAAALQAKGWTIKETALGMHCTDSQGAEFVYNGLQAVRYGTWHDVTKCMDVPLPDMGPSPADLEEAFSEAIGPEVYQKLLGEQWLPFQGVAHLRLSKKEAVAREVVAAREFLASLQAND